MSFLQFTEETTIPQPVELGGKKTVRLSAIEVAGQLRPKGKDSDGNDIDFIGPQGDQGPPGPAISIIDVVNIASPTELNALTIVGQSTVMVKQTGAGDDQFEGTVYLALTSRPFAQNLPYVVNDAVAGQYVAIGGRHDKGARRQEKAIHRGGRGQFSLNTQTFTLDATDTVIGLNATDSDTDAFYYSLAAGVITFAKAGKYLLSEGFDFIGVASTTARNIVADLELAPAVGAFVKLPLGRMNLSNLNNSRPKSGGKNFEISVNAGDRLRMVANVSTQAANTRVDNPFIRIEKVS